MYYLILLFEHVHVPHKSMMHCLNNCLGLQFHFTAELNKLPI